MKNAAQFLFATLAIIVLFSSCDMSNQGASIVNTENQVNLGGTRAINLVNLNGTQVSLEKNDILEVKKTQSATAVTSIMGKLVTAENEDMLLDVNFTMEDKPVSDLFVFGIETEEEKNLIFEMYDEEGFGLAANNTIKITQGHNYKALNVKNLEDGKYYFKLKDASGKELTRQVEVQHKD